MGKEVADHQDATLLRKMDWVEKYLHYHQKNETFLICMFVSFEKPLEKERLIRALHLVKKRQPLLACCITRRGRDLLFKRCPDKNLEIKCYDSGTDFRKLVRRKIFVPYDDDTLQWRVNLIRSKSDNCLIKSALFHFNHAILDGLASVALVEQLNTTYFSLGNTGYETLSNTVETLPVPISLVHRLKQVAGKKRYLKGLFSIFAELAAAKKFYMPKDVDPGKIRSDFLFLKLSRQETGQLVKRYKSCRTTMHGLISASAIKAMREMFDTDDDPVISIRSPVNFRNHVGLSPEDAKTIRSQVVSFTLPAEHFKGRVLKNEKFMQLVHRCMDGMENSIFKNNIELFKILWADAFNISHEQPAEFCSSLTVSNVGRFELLTPDSKPFLNEFWTVISDNSSESLLSLVTISMNGSLCITITYPPGIISKDQAELFGRLLVKNLKYA